MRLHRFVLGLILLQFREFPFLVSNLKCLRVHHSRYLMSPPPPLHGAWGVNWFYPYFPNPDGRRCLIPGYLHNSWASPPVLKPFVVLSLLFTRTWVTYFTKIPLGRVMLLLSATVFIVRWLLSKIPFPLIRDAPLLEWKSNYRCTGFSRPVSL